MTKLFSFIEMLGAAQRAGNAARNHRVPSAQDLRILGIPRSVFGAN